MKYVIRPAARQDILKQFLYLLEKSVPKKLKNPRLQGLRRWPVEDFEVVGIYYLRVDEVLRVVRVLHGKRDVERILDEQTE